MQHSYNIIIDLTTCNTKHKCVFLIMMVAIYIYTKIFEGVYQLIVAYLIKMLFQKTQLNVLINSVIIGNVLNCLEEFIYCLYSKKHSSVLQCPI